MSKSYNVVSGDTLGDIAVKYYGSFSKWVLIRDANPQLLGRKKAPGGSPLIYPGDVLVIPFENSDAPKINGEAPLVLNDAAPGDFSILIDGKSFTGFSGAELSFSLDSFDTFAFSAPFDDSVFSQKAAFMPYTYKSCAVYLDKELLFSGRLLTPNPEVSPASRSVALQGYPHCGVLNDCTLPDTKYPPEYSGKKLDEIAKDALAPFGLKVVTETDTGSPFNEVGCDIEKTILSFLVDLAKQRGVLVTNTAQGDLLLWKAKNKKPVAVFKEGEYPLISCAANFDAQKMYSHITGYTKTKNEKMSEKYTYVYRYLANKGILRPHSFVIDDAEETDLKNSVLSYAGRMFADAVSYTLSVAGHGDSFGNIYKKNTIVSVLAPGSMIFRETLFLVKTVRITRDNLDSDVTTLEVVLPGSYSGEIPEVMPWEE